jgi:hypothetical protein
MINIAPRYGKTELAVKNFISHGLSINPAAKFIHLSYSTELALDNSEAVKDIIEHESFKEIFPEVVIKKDSKAKKKWYTTAGGGVYATSTGGQVTGFGAGTVDDDDEKFDEEFEDEFSQLLEGIGINQTFGGALIIDDPIKPEDADSEIKRNRVNNRYDSTIKNRVNSRNTPIIIMMQRVHEDDLCGYLLKNEPGEWFVLSLPCIQVDDEGKRTALWEFKHTLAELDDMNSRILWSLVVNTCRILCQQVDIYISALGKRMKLYLSHEGKFVKHILIQQTQEVTIYVLLLMRKPKRQCMCLILSTHKHRWKLLNR